MIDEWNERLRSPGVEKTGMASLSQSDDADVATVRVVPDGFKIVATSYGSNFIAAPVTWRCCHKYEQFRLFPVCRK
jgi:hypothetical protein